MEGSEFRNSHSDMPGEVLGAESVEGSTYIQGLA